MKTVIKVGKQPVEKKLLKSTFSKSRFFKKPQKGYYTLLSFKTHRNTNSYPKTSP